MQWFIDPKDTIRLDIGDDQYIDIKKRLSAKEAKDVQAAGINSMRVKTNAAEVPEEDREVNMGLDMGAMALTRAEKYIVGWSLSREGKPVSVSREAIQSLTTDAFNAIDKALDTHIKAMDEEKKVKNGETTSDSAAKSAA